MKKNCNLNFLFEKIGIHLFLINRHSFCFFFKDKTMIKKTKKLNEKLFFG